MLLPRRSLFEVWAFPTVDGMESDKDSGASDRPEPNPMNLSKSAKLPVLLTEQFRQSAVTLNTAVPTMGAAVGVAVGVPVVLVLLLEAVCQGSILSSRVFR